VRSSVFLRVTQLKSCSSWHTWRHDKHFYLLDTERGIKCSLRFLKNKVNNLFNNHKESLNSLSLIDKENIRENESFLWIKVDPIVNLLHKCLYWVIELTFFNFDSNDVKVKFLIIVIILFFIVVIRFTLLETVVCFFDDFVFDCGLLYGFLPTWEWCIVFLRTISNYLTIIWVRIWESFDLENLSTIT